MPSDSRPFTWTQFIVQFVCGALFGGFIAFLLARSDSGGAQVWVWVLVVAGIVGLVAGFFGDRFWESFSDSLWNPFRWLF